MTRMTARILEDDRGPWLAMLLLAGGYFLGAELGNWLSVPVSKAATFWPPSGILVAVLLLSPTRHWPWLIAAALPANVLFDLRHGRPLWVSLLFFGGNSLEGLAGAAMVRRWVIHRPTLDTVRQVVGVSVLAASLSPAISATVGSTILYLGYHKPMGFRPWMEWWIGDALGVLALAPLLLCWSHSWRALSRLKYREVLAGAGLLGLLGACGWLVFHHKALPAGVEDDYLLLPLLMWIAFRFGLPGITLAGSGLCLLGVYITTHPGGSTRLPSDIALHVLSTQAFLGVGLFTMMLLAALLTERRRATAVIQSRKDHFRLLLDSLPNIAIQGYGPDGVVRYWNQASQTIYGYTADEAMGKNLLDLIIPPDMHDQVAAAIAQGAKTSRMPPAAELMLMRKDGSLTPVYSSHVAIDSPEHGRLMLCVDVDMTEINRLREQLLMAHRMETVGRLTGGISHDFNNLLAVIGGYSEAMQRRLPDDSPLRKYVDEIDNATQRGRTLTQQLLEFSAGQTAEHAVVDMNQMIARVYQMLRQVISHKIDIVLRKESEIALTHANPGQIEQMLVNLALNARDAMPEGGSLIFHTAPVELSAAAAEKCQLPPGRYIKLLARDTGCGMDESTQARIFEPFFTTKGTAGRGLGLSIVYGIVRHSGGAISVESHVGQGTTFQVLLPQAQGASV